MVHAVNHDGQVQIDGARGVLKEPAESSLWAVNGEEKRAVAAAVGKILCHSGMKPAGGGIGHRAPH